MESTNTCRSDGAPSPDGPGGCRYGEHLERYRRGAKENRRFWSRFGGKPPLAGLRILEIGSGSGSLAVEMALDGAASVVGLDVRHRTVDFANAHVRAEYPHIADRVEFKCMDLKDHDDGLFDIVVSKDSFEHILDPDGMLVQMGRSLVPGGSIYAGFGPLYPSPYGDHDRRRTILASWGPVGRLLALVPWGHLALEPVLVKMHNRQHGQSIKSMRDLGLNKLALSDYRRAIQKSGLRVSDFRTNQSGRGVSRILQIAGKLPLVSDFCTHNIYCVLVKN